MRGGRAALASALLLTAVAIAIAIGIATRARTRTQRATSPTSRSTLLDALARSSELDHVWSYDEASGRVLLGNVSGAPGLFLIDTRGNAAPRPLRYDAEWPQDPVLAPGGKSALYTDVFSPGLRLLDLETEQSKILVTPERGELGPAAFAPDGSQVAYEVGDGARSSLHVLTLASGADRVVVSSDTEPARSPAWFGHDIFFFSNECVRAASPDGLVRSIACVPGSRPVRASPDPPRLSPDGSTVAFDAILRGCPRVILADVHDGRWRLADETECGFHPSWSSDGKNLAYLGYPGDGDRTPRIRAVGSTSVALGLTPGVTYQIAIEPSGGVLALGATPEEPRALWRLAGDHAPTRLFTVTPSELARRTASVPTRTTVTSSDGTNVPILWFPATCIGNTKPPVALFLHGSASDVSARYLAEVTYVTAMGYAVVAPNFRGSTGYGDDFAKRSDDLAGQVADLRAAIREARSHADLDAKTLVAVSWSGGGVQLDALVESDPRLFQAIAVLAARPPRWLERRNDESYPSVFEIASSEDDPTNAFQALAARGEANGHVVRAVHVDDIHNLSRHHFEALDGLRAVFDARVPGPVGCEPRP